MNDGTAQGLAGSIGCGFCSCNGRGRLLSFPGLAGNNSRDRGAVPMKWIWAELRILIAEYLLMWACSVAPKGGGKMEMLVCAEAYFKNRIKGGS
jgi:hypothetical protein